MDAWIFNIEKVNLECILPKEDFFSGSLIYASPLYFYSFKRIPFCAEYSASHLGGYTEQRGTASLQASYKLPKWYRQG